jgi:hybrid polyketide synthase/nonribosomal peptide synthetase ACE1
MFSTLTSIGGNSGQSNYAAVDLYMSALSAQRRKHGLAASVLDIGVLYDLGYVNRVDGAAIYNDLRR